VLLRTNEKLRSRAKGRRGAKEKWQRERNMVSGHQAFEKVEMLSSKISPFFSVFAGCPAHYGRSQHCDAIPHQ